MTTFEAALRIYPGTPALKLARFLNERFLTEDILTIEEATDLANQILKMIAVLAEQRKEPTT